MREWIGGRLGCWVGCLLSGCVVKRAGWWISGSVDAWNDR